MGKLAADLRKVTLRKPRLTEWVLALEAEDRAAFDEAISNPLATTEGLLPVLRANGCAVTRETLEAWRVKHAG